MAVQNDDFMAVRFYNTANNGANANTSGRSDLGGRLDTTLANIGLTSRPTNDLFLLANLRYEYRHDITAIARYITTVGGTGAAPVLSGLAATSTTDGNNEPRSLTNWSGKLEASYALPDGYRLTTGFDRDIKERSVNGVRVVGYRSKQDEDTYRVELKRAMAETLSGSLAYLYSDRRGSDYQNLVTLNGVTTYPAYSGSLTCGQAIPAAQLQVTRCGLLQPIYMADRERQKVRLLTDWSPTDQFSAQLTIEGSSDVYGNGRGNPDIGVRQGNAQFYSLDLSYQATERWKFNTWLSRSLSSIDEASIAGRSQSFPGQGAQGAGTRGKLPYGIEVGADYVYAFDKTAYNTRKEDYGPFSNTAIPGAIPDISYRQQTLKLFGTYPVDPQLSLRLDFIADHRKSNDWTWNDWIYTDGTRVILNPDSKIYFVGMSLRYAFR